NQQRSEGLGKGDRLPSQPALRLTHPGAQHHVNNRTDRARPQVHQHVAAPFHVVEPKPPRQLNNRQRHERPYIPVPHRPTHRLRPRDWPACLVTRQVKLDGKREANERPENENHSPSQRAFLYEWSASHKAEFSPRFPVRVGVPRRKSGCSATFPTARKSRRI